MAPHQILTARYPSNRQIKQFGNARVSEHDIAPQDFPLAVLTITLDVILPHECEADVTQHRKASVIGCSKVPYRVVRMRMRGRPFVLGFSVSLLILKARAVWPRCAGFLCPRRVLGKGWRRNAKLIEMLAR